MYQKLVFLSVILFIFTAQCSDNGVKPPQKEELCEISDTTSHMVNWQVDTIGIFSSVLYDVDAIDANNVWAVGVINTPEYDSTWNTPSTRHNAVKWNGTDYIYYQLPVHSYDGSPTIQELRVVLPIAENNIWLFSYVGSYVHWDGTEWTSAYIEGSKGTPRAVWAASSSEFYLVGNNGSITFYNGSSFTLMESNTDIDLFDIKGYVDDETGERHIWVLGSEDGVAVVLQYKNEQWINIWDMDLLGNYRFPHALYIPDDKSLIMSVWSGHDLKGRLYCFDQNDLIKNQVLAEHNTYDLGIAGENNADLFITGNFNQTEHFNGQNFYRYPELTGDGNFHDIDVYNNHIYIVGIVYQVPLFAHGVK